MLAIVGGCRVLGNTEDSVCFLEFTPDNGGLRSLGPPREVGKWETRVQDAYEGLEPAGPNLLLWVGFTQDRNSRYMGPLRRLNYLLVFVKGKVGLS